MGELKEASRAESSSRRPSALLDRCQKPWRPRWSTPQGAGIEIDSVEEGEEPVRGINTSEWLLLFLLLFFSLILFFFLFQFPFLPFLPQSSFWSFSSVSPWLLPFTFSILFLSLSHFLPRAPYSVLPPALVPLCAVTWLSEVVSLKARLREGASCKHDNDETAEEEEEEEETQGFLHFCSLQSQTK